MSEKIPNTFKNMTQEQLAKVAWYYHKALSKAERQLKCTSVSRVEVIDDTGRALVKYLTDDEYIVLDFQDDDRTLKVFVNNYESNRQALDELVQHDQNLGLYDITDSPIEK